MSASRYERGAESQLKGTEAWDNLKKGTRLALTCGKPLRAFRHFCLAKDQHALCGKAFRMLAAPCVQRLRTSVRSGSPAVRVRCLDRQPAGATRPRQQRARASRAPASRLPRIWFTTTKTPACVCLWHRRFAGRSKLGQGCCTPHRHP